MKKILFTILFFFLVIISFGQIQNISELSTGQFENSFALTDQNRDVLGYVYFFNKGLTNDSKEKQYEYILLDKNLNKVTNGDFNMVYSPKLEIKTYHVLFNKQMLYLSTIVYKKQYSSMQYGNIITQIDLKTNTVKKQSYVSNQKTLDNYSLNEIMNVKTSFFLNSQSYMIPYIGESNVFYSSTKLFSRNKKLMYGKVLSTKQIDFLDHNLNTIFAIKNTEKEDKKDYKMYIATQDKNKVAVVKELKYKLSPDNIFICDISNPNSIKSIFYNYSEPKIKEYYDPNIEFGYKNNQLLVTGEIKKAFNGDERFKTEYKPTLGIRRSIYDVNGKELLDKKIYYNDIFGDYKFRNGTDNEGYKFSLRQFFNYSDNSFSLLIQKEKQDLVFGALKTTDYILANFDKNGNLINHQLIDKTKNRYYDTYLFSQENREDDEVLFFYSEKVKENSKKEWYLVINKLKKGKLTQTKIPFKTDSSDMRFRIAKYGYIYITEYDKDDKEVSFRIEKLEI